MQSIAETCVRFDAAHLSINLVSEIALPMFPTLSDFLSWSHFCQKSQSAKGYDCVIHGFCDFGSKFNRQQNGHYWNAPFMPTTNPSFVSHS